MNSIKLALLGGAALAVTSAAAHADDLTALKAQIESLNARIAAVEAAPAVPAGYSLVTVAKGEELFTPGLDDASAPRAQAHLIQVLPTADAPAGSTVSWSGQTWAALVADHFDGTLNDEDDSVDDLDVISRGKLVVKAATDTAVGEVGVKLDIRANWRDREEFGSTGTGSAYFDSAWGYWQVTPELTIGGGKAGSVGNVGYGIDGACTCYTTDNAIAMDPGGRSQMRLSYASGPIGLDLAVQDADGNGGGDELSYAGRLKFSNDNYNASINAFYHDAENNQIGGGVGLSVDMISLSIGAAMGKSGDEDFTTVSALASAKLSDEIHAEIGAGLTDEEGDKLSSVMGGVYYSPVSQLEIGVEAEYNNYDGYSGYEGDETTLSLVTAYSF